MKPFLTSADWGLTSLIATTTKIRTIDYSTWPHGSTLRHQHNQHILLLKRRSLLARRLVGHQ